MKKISLILLLGIQMSYVNAQTPSSGKNYVMETVVRTAGKKTVASLGGLPVDSANRTISYFDGLGRPLQSVSWQASPTRKDIVQHIEYDAMGREVRKYLPYAEQTSSDGSHKAAAASNQSAFYGTPGWDASVKKTDFPYSQTILEASPLNRVLEQGAPGVAWQPHDVSVSGSGHTVRPGYAFNAASEVPLWVVGSPGASTGGNYYAANRLYKTISRDENWTSGKIGTTEEFKDLEGRVVMKRVWETESVSLSTHYIYDDLGNLRYVVPPKVTATSFTEAVSDANFTGFIYAYHYDGRKRLIEKKVPGKGWEHMVYNRLDQLVYSQDAVQRGASTWAWSKYDVMGRPALGGLQQEITATREYLQAVFDTGTDPNWEVRTTAFPSGYTISTQPKSIDEHYWAIQTSVINYYDSYDIPGYGSSHHPSVTASDRTRGMQTASRVRLLGTATMLLTVMYYDEEGRLVETVSDNHLGGMDRVVNTYSFAGELTASIRTHFANSVTTTVANAYVYDHMGRKISTRENINSQGEVTLNRLEYNEVGQLKKKNLHSTDGTTFLQNTTFGYNERGWMKSSTSNEFSMQLDYQDGTHPQYNGNIANQRWGSSLGNVFTYQYDKLNRLYNATSTGVSMSEALTYDVMGNITGLDRNGAGTATYGYSGNQLTGVSGGGLTTGSYAYDANGNATTDGRNGVALEYNHLNLPIRATRTGTSPLSLAYTYDATGQKLKKVNSTTSTTTDYVDGIQYTNGAIEFIQTEEGRAVNQGGTYKYEYNLSDHLGNVRYSFDIYGGAVRKLQEDSYYAFGLRNSASAGTNNYLYNGKELQDELGQYDYGARFYDPEIGRWNVVDPLVELYQESTSPYIYVQNNPILLTDPDGRYPDGPGDDAWNFIKGVGRGIATGAKGTYNFATEGAWKAETWKSTGNLVLGLAASNATGPGGIGNTYALDAALGTNTSGAVNGFNGAIASGIDKIENGNAGQKGEVVGQVVYGIAEAIVGSKGTGMAISAVKGARVSGVAGEVAGIISNEATVVRGGLNTPESLLKGFGEHPSGVKGVSVECGTCSIGELSKGLPHKKIGVTTVGEIRAAGGDVIRTSGKSLNHATMTNMHPNAASALLGNVIKNPNL